MGHDKLRKFAENLTFPCLLQPSSEELLADGFFSLRDFRLKGRWASEFFGNENPIVLELGCGKGEYTLDMARRFPSTNFIGIDIKGARLWRGAKTATQEALPNVAFLRTRIEFITAFFGPGEVSEIWLTFSDPQMKSENSRLTSPVFLEKYRSFLAPGGVVHLKTDSRFLYHYTLAVVRVNGLPVFDSTDNLYGRPSDGSSLYEVQTFYEKMVLAQGFKICYMRFGLDRASGTAGSASGGSAFGGPASGAGSASSDRPSVSAGSASAGFAFGDAPSVSAGSASGERPAPFVYPADPADFDSAAERAADPPRRLTF